MSSRRVSALVVMIIALGGAVALADPNFLMPRGVTQKVEGQRRYDQGEKRGWLQELNLTPAQVQQMQAIRNRYRGQLTQQSQALRQAHQQLRNLMAGTASESQIRDQHRQVAALKQKVEDLRFESMLEMRRVLTAEQRRQFANHMQKRRNFKEPRMDQGSGQQQ